MKPLRSFQDEAAVGGPNVPMTLPVAGSTICAYPITSPTARATPGTAATSSSTDSGIGSRSSRLLVWAVKAFSLRTSTSIDEYPVSTRSLKALVIVSVSTKVPAMKPTPSTTDSPVRSSRTFLARRLRIAARNTCQPSSDFRRSSTRSVVGSSISSTIRPSARNTTRSA